MRDTNVGVGFLPCGKNCTCYECTIEKLGRRIDELLGDSISREQQIASLQAENAKLRNIAETALKLRGRLKEVGIDTPWLDGALQEAGYNV